MRLRVALFAPTQTSLYSRLLAHHVQAEDGIDLIGIAVRGMWSWRRVRGEFRRDRARLIAKVYRKLILGEAAYPAGERETLPNYAAEVGLPAGTLNRFAKRNEVPIIQVSDLNDPVVDTFLRDLGPDIVVFTGGGLIRPNILEIPKLGILNCHSGILPAYRGMDVVEWAILEAEEAPAIGLTLHYMDAGVDTGPILIHHHEHIRKGDTLGRIRQRLEPEMVKLMLAGLRGLRDGDLVPQPQTKSDGRQYFVMHPRLKSVAAEKVIRLSNR